MCFISAICLHLYLMVHSTFLHTLPAVQTIKETKKKKKKGGISTFSNWKMRWSLASLFSREKSGSSGGSVLAPWAILGQNRADNHASAVQRKHTILVAEKDNFPTSQTNQVSSLAKNTIIQKTRNSQVDGEYCWQWNQNNRGILFHNIS